MGKLLDKAIETLDKGGWDHIIDRDQGSFRFRQPTISGDFEAVVEGRFYPGAYLDDEIVREMENAIHEAKRNNDPWKLITDVLSGYRFTRDDLFNLYMQSQEVAYSFKYLEETFNLQNMREEVRKEKDLVPAEARTRRGRGM